MGKILKKILFITFILFLLLPEMQMSVQANSNNNNKNETDKTLKLYNNLEKKLAKSKSGTMRVIVQLDEPFKPEGLMSKSQKTIQKNRIKKAQEGVMKDLQNQAKNISNYKTIPYIALEVDAKGLKTLSKNKKVKNITEDGIISKSVIKDNVVEDKLNPKLHQTNGVMDTEKAWSAGYTGSGKTVAILDTGVDKNHSFLQNKVVYEACFSSKWLCSGRSESAGPGSAFDTDGHGTHVAGIAAGNGSSFSGVAKNAKIIAINVLADDGSGTFSDLLNGLERVYLLKDQYDISAVNLSLGGGRFSSACDYSYSSVKNIVDNLKSAGIATIAASGNEYYKSSIGAPACISSVISVGATNNSDEVAYFSNSAYFLDLLAPGNPVYSSLPGGRYGSLSGTSMATPQVTGGFTLVQQKYPNVTVDQIISYMKENGVNVTDRFNNITTPRLNFSWMRPNLPSLGQVQKPTWNGDAIQWNGVTNASQYEVKLYRGSTSVHTQRVASGVRQVNLSSQMTSHGIYSVTVQAIGDNTRFHDGEPSQRSDENRKGIVYFEDFERNHGNFTASGDNSTWEWGAPASGPWTAYSGTKVWATNLSGYYNNNENSYITSPSINLSNILSPITLSWMQFVETERNWDFINVEVSKNGGQTWNPVYTSHGTSNQDWENQSINLDSSYAVSNFKVRFGLTADFSFTYSGFYVDDVMVTGRSIPSLTQVQKPTWNGNTIQWNAVANASQYELKLYRDSTLIKTQRVAANIKQHDFSSLMTDPGAYTVTVQAIGDAANYRDGAVSSPSDVNRKTVTLAEVKKPTWNGNTIQWNAVTNASQYELKLYRDSTLIKTQRVADNVKQYDFTSLMTDPGAYTVTVQAIGDGTNYRDGAVSSPSDVNRKTVTLAEVKKPTWNGNVIQWNAVANASQYELKLYRDSNLIKTQRVAANVKQYDFTSLMTNPGAYTVTVQAIGDAANYRDGAVSSASDVNRKTVKLAQVQKPAWNGDVIQWNAVANASQYELKLYRGSKIVYTHRVKASVRKLNLASKMKTPGTYTVTVQAIGNNTTYRNGAVSVRSNQKITLNQVSKPVWNGNVVQWGAVAKTSKYELKLYRGSKLVHKQQVKASVRKVNLASKMKNPGTYTVTVQAIGNNTTYRNGAVSVRSNQKITLNQVSKPVWNGNVIQWGAVAKTSKYELKLYRGSKLVHKQQVKASVRKVNLASKMKARGTYTVTVQAIGNNKTYKNGPISKHSSQKRK